MNKKNVIDPVCGMEVNPEVSKDNLPNIVYNGKEYYFCSLLCTAAFLDDPSKYIGEKFGKGEDIKIVDNL